jgi:integrase
MAEVYRRSGSPIWYFDITVNGQRQRRSTRRRVKAEAVKVARAALTSALDRAQLPEAQEITLREALFDHYLPSKRHARSYANLQRYAGYVCDDHPDVQGIGGHVMMHDLTSAMMRTYRAARSAQGRSAQTIDHEIKVISAAYNLVRDEYRVRPGLRFPLARPKGKPRYLLPEEEEALLRDLDPGRPVAVRGGGTVQLPETSRAYRQRADSYDLAVMLLDTGCRVGEIAKLTWLMVDTMEWRWLHIFREKVGNEARLGTTQRVREVLKRRWTQRNNSAFVFPGWSDDGAEAPRQGTAAIGRAMNRVGINAPARVARFGRRSARSLRDTFATKLTLNGVALDRVQKLLGHTSPQMTQKYAHLTLDRASDEAVALLDQLAAAKQRGAPPRDGR